MASYYAGIDIGSTMTKAAVTDHNDICASFIGPTGVEHRQLAGHVMATALKQAGLSITDLDYIVATGYGRINVPFADKELTEITCHARGVAHAFPSAKSVIDIGGQDIKVICMLNGRVQDFVMNDKCAAGTGRFLEVIADSLSLDVEQMADLALTGEDPVEISNICTVFAEQEIANSLSKGIPLKNLTAGIHEAMAMSIFRLVKRIRIEQDLVMTGGGAKNPALVKALSAKFNHPVHIPEEPLLTGAIGAAFKGRDLVVKARKNNQTVTRRERILGNVTFYQ